MDTDITDATLHTNDGQDFKTVDKNTLYTLKRAEIMEEEIVALKPRSASHNDPPFVEGLCFLTWVWIFSSST